MGINDKNLEFIYDKNLSSKIMLLLKPEIESMFDDVIDDARVNLAKNKSVKTQTLTSSLSQKVIIRKPTNKYKYASMNAYVGVNVNYDNLVNENLKTPANYALLVEFGGEAKNRNDKGSRYIPPKPFFRPALAGIDKKFTKSIKSISKKI